jgi:hypothetical protein
MLMQSPFAPQLASIGDMAEVFPRASEDTHWTWNCIDMDDVAAYYGVLNTPEIPRTLCSAHRHLCRSWQLPKTLSAHKLHDMDDIDAYCY